MLLQILYCFYKKSVCYCTKVSIGPLLPAFPFCVCFTVFYILNRQTEWNELESCLFSNLSWKRKGWILDSLHCNKAKVPPKYFIKTKVSNEKHLVQVKSTETFPNSIHFRGGLVLFMVCFFSLPLHPQLTVTVTSTCNEASFQTFSDNYTAKFSWSHDLLWGRQQLCEQVNDDTWYTEIKQQNNTIAIKITRSFIWSWILLFSSGVDFLFSF